MTNPRLRNNLVTEGILHDAAWLVKSKKGKADQVAQEAVKAGKTGYTSIAMNTLVTYAEKDGVELLCVVMKGYGGGAVYSGGGAHRVS